MPGFRGEKGAVLGAECLGRVCCQTPKITVPKTELETEAKRFVIQKAIGPVIFDGLASLESYYL